jgi:hypothetical protein
MEITKSKQPDRCDAVLLAVDIATERGVALAGRVPVLAGRYFPRRVAMAAAGMTVLLVSDYFVMAATFLQAIRRLPLIHTRSARQFSFGCGVEPRHGYRAEKQDNQRNDRQANVV